MSNTELTPGKTTSETVDANSYDAATNEAEWDSPERTQRLVEDVHIGVQEIDHMFPYEIIDLSSEEPRRAIRYLKELAEKTDENGSQEYVFHGAHTTGFHEKYGLPPVEWNQTLDPRASRQTDNPAIYATTGIEGALVHAILKHRPEDIDEENGQTFALNMNGKGKEVLMSSRLQQAARQDLLEFTDGFLYVLPASEFSKSWQGGDHEVTANHEVTPLLGIKVGKKLGTELMSRVKIVDFIEDQE